LGDDVRKRYEKDFSSIEKRKDISRAEKERETRETFHQKRERERFGFGERALVQ